MTETARLLTASRTAHQQAKVALRRGEKTTAVALFAVALQHRLDARALDPTRADPTWLTDAQHPPVQGEKERRYKREAGLTVADVAAKIDADLELYYREHMGERVPPMAVQGIPDELIMVPAKWETRQSGLTPCATCGHREDEHIDDSEDVHGARIETKYCDGSLECMCEGYVNAKCKHVFEPKGADQRVCAACGEIQQLVPVVALADTHAYQQLAKERS